ncbi:MAG: pilus assembly protein PilN [Gammaproteobacteria bacterium]|mgnify:CR=1 FL=1|nr:MAG: pilus assembly protein PilN [Gammaproteobacteria bacterium]
MTQINLLPWREELRAEKQTEFAVLTVVVAVIAGLVCLAVHMFNEHQIDNQNKRNNMIQQEITIVDRKIKEIKDIEERKEALEARIGVIEGLQSGRPEMVRLFNEFIRIVPKEVYIESFEQKGGQLTIKGVALSQSRVSEYMENLDKSPIFGIPKLKVITAKSEGQTKRFLFTLQVKLASKEKTEDQ